MHSAGSADEVIRNSQPVTVILPGEVRKVSMVHSFLRALRSFPSQ
jgi:hypothetical protein